MENKIINLLSIKKNINMSYDDIKKELDINKEELDKVLTNLERKGTIYKNKSGKYSLVSRTSLKIGVVQMGKKRRTTVVIDGLGSYDLIYNKNNIVENNSKVLVELNTNIGSATVVKVLNSKSDTYIGQIIRKEDKLVIRSKHREDIVLNKDYPEGVYVVVDSSTNRIKEIIDSEYEVKIKKMMVKEGVPITYSDAYLKELNEIPEELSKEMKKNALKDGAIDLRDRKHVTLDSDDTKDFDDSFCYENNTLIISIADVPGIINENSVIEKDAIERGISYYYPGFVNPMFHKKISNGICSLNPGTDRLANSIIYKINPGYSIIPYSFKKSIIDSRAKLTYEKANEYLEEGRIPKGYEDYTRMLNKSYEIAEKLKNNMLKNGFLMFTSDEVKILFDKEKNINIKGRHQGKAEELIEFFMLLYNMTKTNYMVEHNLPFIARNHDFPNQDKIKEWADLLIQRGYKVDRKKEQYNNDDIKKILESYKGKEEQIVLDKIGIRSQAKAGYDSYNKGHFALGLKAYATFTSPIRRLADYINERIFQDAIKYGDDYARNKWEPRLEALAKICTDAELKADKIERKAYELKKLEYMSKIPVGKVYKNAIISSVEKDCIYVLIPEINIYGKIYINKNHYQLADSFSLINKINSERIIVGDRMDVILNKVDMDKEEILLLRNSYRKEDNYEEKKGKKRVKKR